MCKWLSTELVTLEGEPWSDEEDTCILFESEEAAEKTGYCTCWIEKPEGKELLDLFVQQCIQPQLERLRGCVGQIKIIVN